MNNRLNVQHKLEQYCSNVYFQPGENITLEYPCIVYNLADISSESADNINYLTHIGYDVTYITKSPLKDIPLKMVNEIPTTNYKTSYVVDNLYHTVLTTYYEWEN